MVRRFPNNPIITPQTPGVNTNNINGPSLIRVPDWVEEPLGRYYLYFAAHKGKHIPLAYSDRIEGPWTVHEAGALRLQDVPICYHHIASPDVHVDEERREIRMYFHGPVCVDGVDHRDGKLLKLIGSFLRSRRENYWQKSLVATSRDGLHFTPVLEVLGDSYFRVFHWGGWYYALAWGGKLFRSRDGLTPFEGGPTLFDREPGKTVRHCAVRLDGDVLSAFYSRIGDCPESILLSRIHLTSDWAKWRETETMVVLAPETEYEGASLSLEASKRGPAEIPVNEVRDPALFSEDGRDYLLYSVAGEGGIAMAELAKGVFE